MASTSPQASAEAKELSLVGKVELRIGLADDNKLEDILKTYLAPLLLKLASEHKSVRDKVIAICQHINIRIKPRSIKLPVEKLLRQFKDHVSVPLIRYFDILYIQQGIGRLSVPEQLDLLPILIQGISLTADPVASHGPQLFHLLVRILNHFSLPPKGSKDDTELRTKLGMEDADAQFLSHWLGKFLRLVVVRNSSAAPVRPGLSTKDYEFLTLNNKPAEAWDPSNELGLNLTESKVATIKFLSSGAFNDKEKLLPALTASADLNSRISEIGEDLMKRALPSIDVEDRDLVGSLFQLYLGTNDIPPVRPPMQMKILSILSKSGQSTSFTKEILQLVNEGLMPTTNLEDPRSSYVVTGRELLKLRSAIFSYLRFLCRVSTANAITTTAPSIIHHLKDFIEVQGWPKPENLHEIPNRGAVYEIMGLLASKLPPETDNLSWLFRSLAEDSSGKDVSVSIEEALSNILGAFSGSRDATTEQSLKKLLLQNMTTMPSDPRMGTSPFRSQSSDIVRSTRYVAVRFANRCLSFDDTVARWIDILAVGGAPGDTPEVADEGRRGLDPNWYRMNTSHLRNQAFAQEETSESFEFPKFANMVSTVFLDSQEELQDDPGTAEAGAIVRAFKNMWPRCFLPAILFLRNVLTSDSLKDHGKVIAIDSDWSRNLDVLASQDVDFMKGLKAYIAFQIHRHHLRFDIFFQACFTQLLDTEAAQAGDHGSYFVDLCSLVPSDFLTKSGLTTNIVALKPSIFSNNPQIRKSSAHAFGLLTSHDSCPVDLMRGEIVSLVQLCETWKDAIGGSVNQINGALRALAYLFSRLRFRRRDDVLFDLLEGQRLRFIALLTEMLDSSSFWEGVFGAINQLCLSFMLSPSIIEPHCRFPDVVDRVAKRASSSREDAIIALGRLSMTVSENDDGDTSDDLAHVEEQLLKLSEIREAEAQFAVGEALSYLASGWESQALSTHFDVEGEPLPGPQRSRALSRILLKALDGCMQTKPSLKRAACVWLLCLLQFCGHRREVQENLTRCQAAFKHCLSDREDIVQETASRGLGLVYEKGNREMKDDLVRDLVRSFSDNKASGIAGGNVSEDTQLFEPGALPTGGDKSVTTYKDILNLASEVGDSSLVYRFMSLAANNNIWSSRAAFGRFGLSNVFADSSVEGYLAQNPKLYPKLYRYRFDPNPNVRRSMNDIWNALVKDPSSTIKQHFGAIVTELLENGLSREWRVREACCNAVADLVQGREISQYETYLADIWALAFKVMDDIKDSVRVAATKLARTLTTILTRSLETGEGSSKTAPIMLKHVLPFLLSTSGLESSAEDVQSFALKTLIQIIKKANVTVLGSYSPELIERLTLLLSALEPQVVNYLHLNASKYNLTEQKIDDMRLSSIRTSPLMEAIEHCLDLLDDRTMDELRPRMERTMKDAVGLPSKVGCSRVLVSLSTRRAFIFRPHADFFLKLLQKHVMDRNETVSSSYAVAAGYVARGASDTQILKLVETCKKLYFQSEEDKHRLVAGDILYALSKHCTDRFTSLGSDILPFVYVAKHDGNEQVRDQFQNTWNENVGGSRAVMLYLKEISAMCSEHIDSARWSLKHAASRAIAQAVIAISAADIHMTIAQAEIVWPILVRAIGGKTWDGKEVVLIAFSQFVKAGSPFWRGRQDVANEITKIITREAKRQNASYRPFAIRALGQVAQSRTDIDMLPIVLSITRPLTEQLTSSSAAEDMDIDGGDNEASTMEKRTSLLANIIEAAIGSVTVASAASVDYGANLTQAFELVGLANREPDKALFTSTMDALRSLFQREGTASSPAVEGLDQMLLNLLFGPHTQSFSEAIRLKQAQAVSALRVSEWKGFVGNERLEGKVAVTIREENSAVVKQELNKGK